MHQPCTHGQEVAFFRNSNDIFSFFSPFFWLDLFPPLTIPCSKKSFYFLALQDFIDREGEAPLEGSIPDMTSSTELATYISSPATSCSFSPLFSNFWERKYDFGEAWGLFNASCRLYVTLQKIYQAKAEADFFAIEQNVGDILKKIGRDPDSISKAVIKSFCKNARKLTVSLFS